MRVRRGASRLGPALLLCCWSLSALSAAQPLLATSSVYRAAESSKGAAAVLAPSTAVVAVRLDGAADASTQTVVDCSSLCRVTPNCTLFEYCGYVVSAGGAPRKSRQARCRCCTRSPHRPPCARCRESPHRPPPALRPQAGCPNATDGVLPYQGCRPMALPCGSVQPEVLASGPAVRVTSGFPARPLPNTIYGYASVQVGGWVWGGGLSRARRHWPMTRHQTGAKSEQLWQP